MLLLITGGAGFIGSHFVRLACIKAEDVLVVDAFTYAGSEENLKGLSKNVIVEHANIRDINKLKGIFRKHRITHVVHLAAETHVDRSIANGEPFTRTNILGTANLLEAARIRPPKMFVYVSTDEVYGSVEHGLSTENDILRPSSPYSASKAAGEMLCLASHRTHGMNIAITRGTNTYGPGQHPEKLIPCVVEKINNGERVPVYGDGLQQRDWIYVKDHCDAIWQVLTVGEPGEIYNIGARNVMTNLELIKSIGEHLGKAPKIKYATDRKGHDRRYAIDPTKLETLLQWKPSHEFRYFLRQTVRFPTPTRVGKTPLLMSPVTISSEENIAGSRLQPAPHGTG